MIVSQNLLDEIDEKKELISEYPEYFLRRSNLVRTTLRRACNVHSFWIEHPELRTKLLRDFEAEDTSEFRARANIGMVRINDAWKYLKKVSGKSNELEYISSRNILEVLSIVEPELNSGSFRHERVSMRLSGFTPPNHLSVPDLAEKFCYEVNNGDLHPVEVAAQCHLYIAAIQPGLDGNKRTGRLFQNTVLHNYDLPPAVIPVGERTTYIDLLEPAMASFRESDYRPQIPFCNYVAGKVNSALDYMIDDLRIPPKKHGRK